MRKDVSSKELRRLVQTNVQEIAEAARYASSEEEFKAQFNMKWAQIQGIAQAAAVLGLGCPYKVLRGKGKVYTLGSVWHWAVDKLPPHIKRAREERLDR